MTETPDVAVDDRWFFCPAERGFFAANHPNRPTDAIEVSAARRAELLAGQEQGYSIEMVDGAPQSVAHPRRPLAELVRMERDGRLAASDGIMQRHQDQLLRGTTPSLSAEQLTAWLDYREALRSLPLQPGFPQEISWPEVPT